jgi:Right handed beta helix region
VALAVGGILVLAAMIGNGGPAAALLKPSGAPAGSEPTSVASAGRTVQAVSPRAFERRLERVGPGEVLVLRPGVYGRRGTTTTLHRSGTAKRPITIRGAPGRRPPRILGAVHINGSHIRLRRLVFAGPTGRVNRRTADNPGGEEVQVAIGGHGRVRDVTIAESVVRNSDWHAGIFVVGARNVQIIRNRIYKNGDARDPSQENQSHGIYWYSGSGTIANNLINRNLARGVQLNPRASRVTVKHNTVVANGKAGVLVGGGASHNRIVNNILARNGDRGIRSFNLTGRGNVARANLEWRNRGRGALLSAGLAIKGRIVAPPRFAGGGFRLRPSSRARDEAVRPGGVAVDFRGRSRPVGPASDLGAYESW